MENKLFRMRELQRSRNKSVKKLTKVLNTLVNLEWEISGLASQKNDNIFDKQHISARENKC